MHAGHRASRRNVGQTQGLKSKTPPGPTPSSLLGKGLRSLSPQPASTWRLEPAQPPGSSQGRMLWTATAAGTRCSCAPGHSPAAPATAEAAQHPPMPAPSHASPLPCQPPRAHPSCTFFTHLLRRLYLGSELPRHGSALEKHHTEKSAPHRG